MKEGCQSIVLIGKGSRHDRRPFHIEHGTDQVGFGAIGAANVDCLPGKSAESALLMCRICARFNVPVSTLIDGYGVHTHSLAKARDVRSAPMASIVAHPPPPPRFPSIHLVAGVGFTARRPPSARATSAHPPTMPEGFFAIVSFRLPRISDGPFVPDWHCPA